MTANGCFLRRLILLEGTDDLLAQDDLAVELDLDPGNCALLLELDLDDGLLGLFVLGGLVGLVFG